ncbi:MAG: LapA family protein [Aliidongia sp.]
MRFVYWGLTAVLAVVCAVFAAYNRGPVALDLWPFPAFELPLFLAVLGPLAIGFLFGGLIAWLGHLGLRRDRRRLTKQAERLQAQLDQAKEIAPPGRSLAS